MLKIEDLKVGDELVCIDRDSFLKNGDMEFQTRIISEDRLIIHEIVDFNVYLADRSEVPWAYVCSEELKYFKKKGQYTFNDLIDVAVQAFRDGVIFTPTFLKQNNKLAIVIKGIEKERGEIFPECSVERCLKHIQSLYKETFVIECEDDLNRIKDDCNKITLSNGQLLPKYVFRQIRDGYQSFIAFRILKGATVEQERPQ